MGVAYLFLNIASLFGKHYAWHFKLINLSVTDPYEVMFGLIKRCFRNYEIRKISGYLIFGSILKIQSYGANSKRGFLLIFFHPCSKITIHECKWSKPLRDCRGNMRISPLYVFLFIHGLLILIPDLTLLSRLGACACIFVILCKQICWCLRGLIFHIMGVTCNVPLSSFV